MKPIFHPLMLAMCISVTCYASSPLESLFERKDYAAFLPQAEAKASAGDAEALFLLGKAYHLARGVAEDRERARAYYQDARSLGSARASHNLGSMAREQGDVKMAVEFFEEALERGLKLPTLYNLAQVSSPEVPTNYWSIPEFVQQAGRAGDYLARAYAEDGKVETLFEASRQYTQVARQALPSDLERLDPVALRARAIEWLEKGMAEGFGQSWTNYGVLLMDEGKYDEARAALLRGTEKGIAVAHYHLAGMASKGQGLEGRDAKQALHHYEQAALMGMKEAVRPAHQALLEYLGSEEDLDRLEEGLRRLEALGDTEAYDAYAVDQVVSRVEWARKFRAQQGEARSLPSRPMILQACGLGLEHPYGSAYNLGHNTHWRLAAYRSLERPQRLMEGQVDADGCARSSGLLPADVRELLDQGVVFALQFPNYTLPLVAIEAGGQIVLEMQPQATPIPN
ncbi:tetratricopeptide repeat protein [Pseudomonas anguilliseptica]